MAPILAMLVAGCSDDLSRHWQEEEKLAAQEQKWRMAAPPVYEIRVTETCLCERMGPVPLVFVEGETPTGIRFDDKANQFMTPEPGKLYSVPLLFQLLKEAYRTAEHIEVTYDDFYGYPRRIAIDPDTRAGNDETGYEVQDFTPVSR